MHQPWLSQKKGFFRLLWPPSEEGVNFATLRKAFSIVSSRSSTDGPESGSNLGLGEEKLSFFRDLAALV